jgi:hypothetical protein
MYVNGPFRVHPSFGVIPRHCSALEQELAGQTIEMLDGDKGGAQAFTVAARQ